MTPGLPANAPSSSRTARAGSNALDGREYPSVKALADEYGIKRRTLERQLDSGWSLKDALTRLPDGAAIDGRLSIVSHIEDGYHLIRFDGREDVWTHARIMRYMCKARSAQASAKARTAATA